MRITSHLGFVLLVTAAACGDDTTAIDGGPGDADANPGCVAVSGTPALGLEQVASGLDRPNYATSPPGDPRLFVVGQRGVISIIEGGEVLAAPFLDISDQVVDLGGFGDEQGLLGLAFHPDYATNGRFYVFYTNNAQDQTIAEYQVSGDPDVADPSSATVVLELPDVFSNHNGGMLAFGPNDGYLYIGYGDGGAADDPMDTGQDPTDLYADILRIDVTTLPYLIPASNPFVGSAINREEIWAFGLRNPWRFSFDRETADLYIGDVGQNMWEEIDVEPASSAGGLNYGWSDMEGAHCFNNPGCDMTGKELPVYEYSHAEGCSVTGGYVYRGCRMPGHHGKYFFGEFCTGFVRSFVWDGAGGFDTEEEWDGLFTPNLVSFGEDSDGELYLIEGLSGVLYRIVPQ